MFVAPLICTALQSVDMDVTNQISASIIINCMVHGGHNVGLSRWLSVWTLEARVRQWKGDRDSHLALWCYLSLWRQTLFCLYRVFLFHFLLLNNLNNSILVYSVCVCGGGGGGGEGGATLYVCIGG